MSRQLQQSKFNLMNAISIRQELDAGIAAPVIAERHGVDRSTISKIGRCAAFAPVIKVELTDELVRKLARKAATAKITIEELAARLLVRAMRGSP